MGQMHANLLPLITVRTACRTGMAQRIRESAGISRKELASVLGVDDATVARWETGARTPRTDAALRYAEVLDQLQGAIVQLPVSA